MRSPTAIGSRLEYGRRCRKRDLGRRQQPQLALAKPEQLVGAAILGERTPPASWQHQQLLIMSQKQKHKVGFQRKTSVVMILIG